MLKACYDSHMQEAHKPIDRWLGLLSAAIGVILFLIPKTPSIVVLCLVLIFLLLIHPVWNLWWVEKRLIRRLSALLILLILLGWLGRKSWPTHQPAETKTEHASSLPREEPSPVVKNRQVPTTTGSQDVERHHLRRSSKTAGIAAPLPEEMQLSKVQLNTPNGIAIGGDNLGSATVNNTFSDVYPRPGTIPKVSFCISQSMPTAMGYETLITIKTDTEISAPFWALVFDGPANRATIDMEDVHHEPFGWSDGHPFQSGQRLEPLGTLPAESRIVLGANESTVVDRDNIIRIQVTEIGPPFGGPYRPWGPKDNLRVSVQSNQSIRLIAIASGSGRKFLSEHMAIGCGQ